VKQRHKVLFLYEEENSSINSMFAKFIGEIEIATDSIQNTINNPFILYSSWDILILVCGQSFVKALEICRLVRTDVSLNGNPVIISSLSNNSQSLTEAFQAGITDVWPQIDSAEEFQIRIQKEIDRYNQTATLKNQNQEYLEQIREKNSFISIIAHDLKNPFTGIQMLAKTTIANIEKLPPEKLKEFVGMIFSTAEQGSALIEGLLQWSRIQTGKVVPAPRFHVLNAIIIKSISEYSKQASSKNIRVLIQSSISPEITLITDDSFFGTALNHLLSNAIKYSNKGNNIIVGINRQDENFIISVMDKGIGISPVIQKKLFRLDGNVSSEPGTENETGSGLGLILAQCCANKLDGKIWFESEVDKGSTFYFSIPAR